MSVLQIMPDCALYHNDFYCSIKFDQMKMNERASYCFNVKQIFKTFCKCMYSNCDCKENKYFNDFLPLFLYFSPSLCTMNQNDPS